MDNKPLISVVMPVWNGEKYLREAMDSILHQTYSHFEFIIINDGSTDKTKEIIQSYQDPRIIYLENAEKSGLSISFNKGIREAKGTYIARMDADDRSLPERFHKQLNILERDKETDILGSAIIIIDEEGKKLRTHFRETEHVGIKWSSLFSTPLYHPTIMARAQVLKEHPYDETLHNSEDYELWSRLLFTTKTRFRNTREPMLMYRMYPNSFTQTINLDKRVASVQNTISNIERYMPLSDTEKRLLTLLRQERSFSTIELWLIWRLYFLVAFKFSRVEKLSLSQTFKLYPRLLALAIFLAKHKIKHS